MAAIASRFTTAARHFATMSKAADIYGVKVLETVELVPGKLTKEIVEYGAGEAMPARGQTVTAHYDGRLTNGVQFDASRKRGKPFNFRVGIGQVISGWDVGMASMKKGEKAILTCAPDYAYGDEGAGDVIPPRATLHFLVELIEFK